MNTKKGIVFEHTPSYSIFLTEDGRFQKGIPVPSSVLVGEEIEFHPYPSKVQKFLPDKKAWMAPVIAAVAIIFMFFSVLLPAQSNVLAYVQVDFNPSVELGIDEYGDVQHFIGLNEEGVILKREVSFWKGKPLSRVLSTIVATSESNGQENHIEVTTIYKEQTHHKSLENIITTAVAESTKKVATKPIHIKEATIEERLKANEKGISVDQFKQNIQKEKNSEPNNQKSPKVKPEKKQPKVPDKKDENENTKGNKKTPDKENGKEKKPEKENEKGKKSNMNSEASRGSEEKQQNQSAKQGNPNNQDENKDRNNDKKQERANNKHQKESNTSNNGQKKNGNVNNDKNDNKAKSNKSKGEKRQ